MQSGGVRGGRVVGGGVYIWREEGVLLHAHTHTHTDGFLQKQTKANDDGWLWNKQLHNVFVLRKQVLFNKRVNVCLSV